MIHQLSQTTDLEERNQLAINIQEKLAKTFPNHLSFFQTQFLQ